MNTSIHYDAILPAKIRYARDISQNEKIFFLELTSLTNMYGYCWATNSWLADHFNVTERTISNWIAHLKKNDYISITYDKYSHRKIYLKDTFPKSDNCTIIEHELPSYYTVLPPNVRYSLKLSASEKLFYSEIRALCNSEGCCWANNKYFRNLYKVQEWTLQKWLKNLEESKFIFIHVTDSNKRIICLANSRGSKKFIKLKLSTGGGRKKGGGSRKKGGGITPKIYPNNIGIYSYSDSKFTPNNIIINNIIKKDNNVIRPLFKNDFDKFNSNCKKIVQNQDKKMEKRVGVNQMNKILGRFLI